MGPTLAELQAELAEIRTAKRDLLAVGQGYGLGDRRFEGVPYETLVKREKELLTSIRIASGGLPIGVMLADFSRAD
jgi:hypothetical protein